MTPAGVHACVFASGVCEFCQEEVERGRVYRVAPQGGGGAATGQGRTPEEEVKLHPSPLQEVCVRACVCVRERACVLGVINNIGADLLVPARSTEPARCPKAGCYCKPACAC